MGQHNKHQTILSVSPKLNINLCMTSQTQIFGFPQVLKAKPSSCESVDNTTQNVMFSPFKMNGDYCRWNEIKMTDVEHRNMIDWNISFIIELIICNFIRFTLTFFSLYNRAAAEEMWVFLLFELEWPNGVEFLYFGVILIKRHEKPSWVRAVLAQTYLCNHVYGCWSVHLYRFQLWKNKFVLILMKFLWINKTNKSG